MNNMIEAFNRLQKARSSAEIRKEHGIPDPVRIRLLQAFKDPNISADEYEELNRRALLGLSVNLPDTSGRQLALKFT